MKQNIKELKETLNDVNNFENIILQNDLYETIALEQVAVIYIKTAKYYILYLEEDNNAKGGEEAHVFKFYNDDFVLVKDRVTKKRVFEEYYNLFLCPEKNTRSFLKNQNVYKSADCNLIELYKKVIHSKKYKKYNALKSFLKERVVGQSHAIERLVARIVAAEENPTVRGPKNSIFLMGPPAVGKTFLTECIAEFLERPCRVLYMSGYSDRESYHSFCGIHRSFKDAREGDFPGQVAKNPITIIVCDELEKAHPNVILQLYQTLDQGYIHDPYAERDIDLSECILIFTSNVGKEIYNSSYSKYNFADIPKEVLVNVLKNEKDPRTGSPYFSEAIVSRFAAGEIILMNKLAPSVIKEILKREINKYKQIYFENADSKYIIDEEKLASLIVYKNAGNLDLRNLKSEIELFFQKQESMISDYMLTNDNKGEYADLINVDLSSLSEKFFVDAGVKTKSKNKILVCGSKLKENSSNNTELIYKDSSEEIYERKDINTVLIDVTESFSIAEKVFDEIKERFDVPIYVYSYKKNTNAADFHYFTNNGAMDCFVIKDSEGFNNWINQICVNNEFNQVCECLIKRGKTIHYKESYSFDKKNKTFEIIMNLALKEEQERLKNGKIRTFNKDTKKRIACHEAGHVVVGVKFNNLPEIVTIVSRGTTGGYVLTEYDKFSFSKKDIENKICEFLAGRAAEVLIFGEEGVNTGASSDLKEASKLANEYYYKYGMGENIAVLNFDNSEYKQKIEDMLKSQYERAIKILKENRGIFEKIVERLLKDGTLTKEEIKEEQERI